MKIQKMTNSPYKETSSYISFFTKEKKLLTLISWLISIPIIGVLSFFLFVFLAPFAGYEGLLSIKYIGWPIYALLFILIWVIGVGLWLNLLSKRKLTDFQFIKEKTTIKVLLILLIIPSLFLTLIPLIMMRNVNETEEFRKYWRKNESKMGDSDLWLSDKMPMRANESARLATSWMIIILWGLIVIWPVYQLIKSAFNGELEYSILPTKSYSFTFDHFSKLFSETSYLTWMQNTLYIAFITLIVVILGSCFTSFIYSRYRFKTKKSSLILIMTLGLFPAMGAMITHIILAKLLFSSLQLDKLTYLIIIYSAGGILGNIFLLKGYLDSISTEIDDAARIDGCSTLKVFSKIIFPLMKPMLAVIGLGAFTVPFADFILPRLLLNEEQYTLAVGLQGLTASQPTHETWFAAGSLIIAVPISILYYVLQRYMKSGTTSGGVKG